MAQRRNIGMNALIEASRLTRAPTCTDLGFALGPRINAGGRVGKGLLAGVYGWAGAAGTVAFADVNSGLRGGLFTQYMPSTAYPLTEEFADAMLGDAFAGRAGG